MTFRMMKEGVYRVSSEQDFTKVHAKSNFPFVDVLLYETVTNETEKEDLILVPGAVYYPPTSFVFPTRHDSFMDLQVK